MIARGAPNLVKMLRCKNFVTTTASFVLVAIASTHFDKYSTANKIYEKPNEQGNGPMKSISQISNKSTAIIPVCGISFFLVIPPVRWHLSQDLMNWWASLKMEGQ